ncbi:MAG: class I SAM-dependent methyltransferase [Patescibacteria group bacterium]|nr:class I SAM-dependent methyltransferase [Patescibacteria group bacterium]
MDKKKVKKFWDEQATVFGESQLATAPDTYYRGLEIEQIAAYLQEGKSILDVGCGNGYSTFIFAKKFPKSNFVGLDYSQNMINFARSAQKRQVKLKNRLDFHVGDVLSLSEHEEILNKKFDLIISERCLINLYNWDEQKKAILEMKKMLKPGGRIILCENTQEGLKRLNRLRKPLGLPEIKIRWHNYYMPEEKFLEFAKKQFRILDINNIGSLYYIISRVVYAKLSAMENKDPDYQNPINMIAAKLPLLGNFSPNFIFVLQKK